MKREGCPRRELLGLLGTPGTGHRRDRAPRHRVGKELRGPGTPAANTTCPPLPSLNAGFFHMNSVPRPLSTKVKWMRSWVSTPFPGSVGTLERTQGLCDWDPSSCRSTQGGTIPLYRIGKEQDPGLFVSFSGVVSFSPSRSPACCLCRPVLVAVPTRSRPVQDYLAPQPRGTFFVRPVNHRSKVGLVPP